MSAAPMSAVERHAQALREQRAASLARWVEKHRKAEADLVHAREMESAARAARDHAYQQLRELMEGDDAKVVGDTLLLVNARGGVSVRRVDVLPMTGAQSCLL